MNKPWYDNNAQEPPVLHGSAGNSQKYLLAENKDVIVFTHEEIEIGKEADISDALVDIAVKGYKQFASHLQEPEKFLNQVKEAFAEMIDSL